MKDFEVTIGGAKKYQIFVNGELLLKNPRKRGVQLMPPGQIMVKILVEKIRGKGPAIVNIHSPFCQRIEISAVPNETIVTVMDEQAIAQLAATAPNKVAVSVTGSSSHKFWINKQVLFESPDTSGEADLPDERVSLHYRIDRPTNGNYEINITQPINKSIEKRIPDDGSVVIQR